jgi:hypothetical protein
VLWPGRLGPFNTAASESIAEAIVTALRDAAEPTAVERDGAARTARLIAELL